MEQLDNLLDANLDDLADLPEFKPFPNGAYRVTIEFECKEVNKHPSVELKLTCVETLELSDAAADVPVEAGTQCSVLYMLDNEYGQGTLKEVLKPLAIHLGVTKVTELMECAKGTEVLVVTKQRQSKDKTATYINVAKLEVL